MGRLVGIHLSFWQESWTDDLIPAIGKAHQAGFQAAEFPVLDPANIPTTELKNRLDSYQMAASCSTGLGPDTDITHPDAAVREQGIRHLESCLQVAGELESPLLGGVTYAPWAVFPEENRSVRRDRCAESLKQAAELAEKLDIVICLELLNRFEGDLINTVDQGLDLISRVGSEHVRLQLDTFHLNIEADSIGQAIRDAGEYLGHFHCVANNRKPPGQGHIPWGEVREALDAVDYQGYLVAETFVNPRGKVGRGLFIWRDLAEDLDLAARQAADYITRHLV